MPRKRLVRMSETDEPLPEEEAPAEPDPEVTEDEEEVAVEGEEVAVEEWMPTPLLYNVTDACFILGKISKQMLYRLIHTGEIVPVKIGTRSLFTMGELERFVQEHAAG